MFETLFGSNECSLVTHKDGRVEVAFNLGPSVQHVVYLDEGTQVVHAIKSTEDPHWYPKLAEFERLSLYSRLLQKLCEGIVRPTGEQMARLRGARHVNMSDVFKTIYDTKFTELLHDLG